VFEKLKKRLILRFEIKATTPLHIGSGKSEFEPTAVDMPVIRNVESVPYIPGSSIKGKVRSEAERIAREQMPNENVCESPYVEKMCGSKTSKEEDLCIICRIFGTAVGGVSRKGPEEGVREEDFQEVTPRRSGEKKGISRASKVRFRDAFVDGPPPKMEIRPGVAIDRKTGAAAEGHLYTVEAVPVGTKFSLEVVCENLEDNELKLLFAAVKSVRDSALGGLSSRGFGKVEITLTEVSEREAKFYMGDAGGEIHRTGKEQVADWLKTKGLDF
jgi:CRISPR-associated protein Csm3